MESTLPNRQSTLLPQHDGWSFTADAAVAWVERDAFLGNLGGETSRFKTLDSDALTGAVPGDSWLASSSVPSPVGTAWWPSVAWAGTRPVDKQSADALPIREGGKVHQARTTIMQPRIEEGSRGILRHLPAAHPPD